MNVGWNLVTGTATRYLLLAVNVCLGVFLMPSSLCGISERPNADSGCSPRR
jgi:hypothetical protein